MKNKIPTAKEFADRYDWDNSSLDIEELLRDFAKMHVKAALEAAAENSVKMSSTKATIRNCYPEDLIK